MNKEEKYRSEIFKLLSNALEGTNPKELKLLNELFMSEKIENESLIEKIKRS